MRWYSAGGDEGFVLETTGRRAYANNHIIGIGPDGYVHYGADGSIGRREDFSLAERIELAEHMIVLWEHFKSEES